MPDKTQYGFDGGGAARPVSPEQGHQFTLIHHHVNAMQDVRLAVKSIHSLQLQKRN
jgi:hypothetical protein